MRSRPPWRIRPATLRHGFASMLIVGLRLDVNTVSKALGHARASTTLDIYTHEFEKARSAEQVRSKLSDLIAAGS